MPCDRANDLSLLELIARRRVTRSQERRDDAERAPSFAVREPRPATPAPPRDHE